MPSSEPFPDVSRGELRGLLYQELGVDRGSSALHPRVKAVLTFLEETQPTEQWQLTY